MRAKQLCHKRTFINKKCEANSNHVIGRILNWTVLSDDLQEGHKHILLVKLVAEYKFE